MKPISSLAFYSSSITAVLGFGGNSPCYNVNGTLVAKSEVRQCTDGVTTICCTLGRDNPPGGETNGTDFTRDDCLSNGLCQNRHTTNGVPQVDWWLEYCTDKDVESSNCLDVCRNTRNNDGSTRMTPCGVSDLARYDYRDEQSETTRWCCGEDTQCCGSNIGVVVLPRNFTGKAISTTTSSLTATSLSTPSSSSSSTSTPQPATNGLSTGVKAGIGVGAAIGAMGVFLAIFFGYKVYKYKKQTKGIPKEVPYGSNGQEAWNGKHTDARHQGHDLSNALPLSELAEAEPRSPTELPTSHDYRHA